MSRKYPPHPLNAPGPFYVENGKCITCMMPEAEAPELMGFIDNEVASHCYFKRQPQLPEEMEHAIAAVTVSCCGAVRYGGKDASVIAQLKQANCGEQCDEG